MSETGTGISFDTKKAEAFAGRMLSALNDGSLCLMTSIGHRTGLFDAMRDQPPQTSDEVAARAGLNGRYVREWLGAMVTAGVVTVDPQSVRYHLPPEHAAYLTRSAGADNLAVFTLYIPLLGNVEDDIVACFRTGGGVPCERFPRFHAVMAEDSGLSVLSSLESHILPLVPGLADRLARRMRVLDAGCVSGRIINRLAALFPKSRFTGMDLSPDAIRAGREAKPLIPVDTSANTSQSSCAMVRKGLTPVALLVLLVTAASAQTRESAWTPPMTPDGQPDLQGVWADLSATPLERPRALAGRTSLTDAEVAQLKERAERLWNNPASDFVGGDNLFLAVLSNLDTVDNPNATGNSLNMVKREFDNRTSLITDPADGRLPALTPEGVRRQRANTQALLTTPWQVGADTASPVAQRRLPNGATDLSNMLRCISWGVPKIGGNTNYTSHHQIFQGPGYVVFLSEVNHEARVIPLDGRPHLPAGIRQWNGDSRGRWEGNTLVVDTTNFSPGSYFMGSADRLQLTERFTRVGPNRIDYAITVDDSTTWTKPWTAVVRLTRDDGDRVHEFACHEGNYEVVRGILGGARAEER